MHCKDFKRLIKTMEFPKDIKLIEAVELMQEQLKKEGKQYAI